MKTLSHSHAGRMTAAIWAAFALVALITCPAAAGQDASREWKSSLLQDISAWPHSEKDARIGVTPSGLRVEVAAERHFAIAATSHLALPKDMGRIRIQVAEVGGEAEWFVRLYGQLRRPGQSRTAAIAQDENSTGQYVFDLDPRMRQLPHVPLQLQLGVEGPPGAFALFEDVAFGPAPREPTAGRAAFVNRVRKISRPWS